MAERVIKVSMTAQVSNYLANMEAASKATRKVGDSLEAQKAASIAAAKAQGEASKQIGTGLLAVGAIAAVAVGVAVKKFADFDVAISNVKAATQETAENMGLLREAALQAGADTAFSAIEAANAVEELGKAGLTTTQILDGGLNGALSLAAAGGIGVAEAAGYAAIAMKQFGLEGEQIPHVADLLAAGAGKAVGDVADLAQALNQAGLVANGAGQSIEDTTGVLAAFADAGLLGSDAGTSLKSAIIALQAPTDKSRAVMDKYNLSFYDGNGAMLGYSEIAGQLKGELGRLDDETRNAALAQIFGNDALRVANVLYEEGAAGIEGYIDQTNDSGYAAKVAADRLNNLAGDVEALGGSFDTYLIKSGSGANDVLRQTVQIATGLINAVGGLPEPVLGGALAVGGLAAAVVIASGAFLVGVPKVAEYKASLTALKVSAGSAALGVGRLASGLAIAGIAFAIFASEQGKRTAKIAEYTGSLEAQSAALTNYSRDLAKANLTAKQSFGPFDSESTFDAAEKLGLSLELVTDAALGNVSALRKVDEQSRVGVAGSSKLKRQMDETGLSALELAQASQAVAFGVQGESKSVAEAIRVAKQKQSVDGDSVETAATAEEAYRAEADAASELQANLSKLIDTINEANGVGQDAISQNINYEAALDEVAEQIENVRKGAEGYVAGISAATEEGRDNLGMLNDQAAAAQGAAKATFEAGGSAEEYQAALAAGRQTLIDNATALGATADEAQVLADKIFAIPSAKEIEITANTANALLTIDDFILKMGEKSGTINFRANLPDLNGSSVSGNGRMGGFAGGGFTGDGGKYEPAGVVHRKEFVSTSETTANPSNRAALEYMHRGGVIKGYAGGGYVTGRDMDYMQGGGSGGSGGGSSSKTINASYTISGEGTSPGEVLRLIEARESQKMRSLV